MIEIKRVLCPIDLSEFSRHALDHAVTVARWYGATVTAVHVIPPVASMIPGGDAGLYPPLVFTPDDLQQFQAEVERVVQASAGDVPFEALALEGSITAEIIRLAGELPADLLVMGTHGRSGFDRLMLGSITEKMLRKAPCPLLTVPRRAADAPPAAVLFQRILCAVDFSPSSMRALAYAESLAREADGSLSVLHVLEPASVFDPVVTGGAGGGVDSDARNAARNRLRQIVSTDTRVYSHVTDVVTSGKAYREILREASERRVELIVMGAHGGRLGLAAFGSTANHVVREAACPVLTVRA